MRDHTKAFCKIAAETLICPGPVYEFGAYQVDGQVEYADLRTLFPKSDYVGCDMRPGPGVDRVEDVTALTIPDQSAGTVICIETFEHVFEIWRAFDEVFRILKPGGLFIITSPFYFKVHGYPDDYWRMTPSCLRRLMSPYGARLCGLQGPTKTPHTVMALGFKSPTPTDVATRLQRFQERFQDWLHTAEASVPWNQKLKRSLGQVYRSKGERQQIRSYYHAEFTLDIEPGQPGAFAPLSSASPQLAGAGAS